MTSEIREATKEDIEAAMKFSENFKGIRRSLVSKMEDEGFRVIYKAGEKKKLPILMPSSRVLTWDFNSRSLNYLGEESDEIEKAADYLSHIYSDYLQR